MPFGSLFVDNLHSAKNLLFLNERLWQGGEEGERITKRTDNLKWQNTWVKSIERREWVRERGEKEINLNARPGSWSSRFRLIICQLTKKKRKSFWAINIIIIIFIITAVNIRTFIYENIYRERKKLFKEAKTITKREINITDLF